jgi:hypothetical protein
MDAAANSAFAAGDDVFLADEIRGVADHTRNQDLPGVEFHVAPDFESSQEMTPDRFSRLKSRRIVWNCRKGFSF